MPHFSLYPAIGNDTYPLQPFRLFQADAAAVDGQQAVALHGGKRAGQRTAVDAQVVGPAGWRSKGAQTPLPFCTASVEK